MQQQRAWMMTAFVFWALGCQPTKPAPEGQDAQPLVMSYPSDAPVAGVAEGAMITLQKSTLGQEFLLESYYGYDSRQHDRLPFAAGPTRIVTFEQEGARVVMTTPAPPYQGQGLNLLAIFPIIKQTPDEVSFAFEAGLKKMPLPPGMLAAPSDADVIAGQPGFRITQGIIRDIDHSAAGEVQFSHLFEYEWPQSSGVSLFGHGQIRYRLSLYHPDPSFNPTFLDPTLARRFYAIPADPDQSSSLSLQAVKKWHSQQPIVFHLDPRMPEYARTSMQWAMDYWNQQLGENQLVLAPTRESTDVLDLRQNRIHWFDKMQGRSSHVALTHDPRTGQILTAQINLSPLRREVPPSPTGTSAILPDEVTDQDEDQPAHLSDLAVLFTHELGHVLGLGHNFAASSSGAAFARADLRTWSAEAVHEDRDIPAPPSSSFMDYLGSPLIPVLGAWLQRGQEPLPYDQKAIRTLYSESEEPSFAHEVFCDASEVDSIFLDCLTFDSGHRSALASFWEGEVVDSISVLLTLPEDAGRQAQLAAFAHAVQKYLHFYHKSYRYLKKPQETLPLEPAKVFLAPSYLQAFTQPVQQDLVDTLFTALEENKGWAAVETPYPEASAQVFAWLSSIISAATGQKEIAIAANASAVSVPDYLLPFSQRSRAASLLTESSRATGMGQIIRSRLRQQLQQPWLEQGLVPQEPPLEDLDLGNEGVDWIIDQRLLIDLLQDQ